MVRADLGGRVVRIEATVLGGDREIAGGLPAPFSQFTDSIEAVVSAVAASLDKVKPKKATIEFGLEVGLESGQLTALLVKGTGTANLKITVEWG